MNLRGILEDYPQVTEHDKICAWCEASRLTFQSFGIKCPVHITPTGFITGEATSRQINNLVLKNRFDNLNDLFCAMNYTFEANFRSELEEFAK